MPKRKSTPQRGLSAAPAPPADNTRIFLFITLVLVVALFVLRLDLLSRSLWYDEMYTVSNFSGQPWGSVVSGIYSPNNHILSTLLIKLCEQGGAAIGLWDHLAYLPGTDHIMPVVQDTITIRFRLPAMIAGTLSAIALAWPLRSKGNLVTLLPFIVMTIIAGVLPWSLAISTEARGYPIALLLTVLATNVISNIQGWRWIAYVLLMTAAIYTLPITGAILAGHGVALILLRREKLGKWSAALAVIIAASTSLYAPFFSEMVRQSQTMTSPLSYAEFLCQTLRHCASGWNTLGVWSIAVALPLLLIGVPLAWRDQRLKPQIISFTLASALALLLPLFVPAMRQARFAFWLIPLVGLGCYGSIMAWGTWRGMNGVFKSAIALLVAAWMTWQAIILAVIPPSPVVDAVLVLEEKSPENAHVVGIYLGAQEVYSIYFPFFGDRTFYPVLIPEHYARSQISQVAQTWMLVVYPEQLHAFAPDLEQLVLRDCDRVVDLPGALWACAPIPEAIAGSRGGRMANQVSEQKLSH